MTEFLLSVPGMGLVLIVRILTASILVCAGISIFKYKNLPPFFTARRVLSIFLILLAARIFKAAWNFF